MSATAPEGPDTRRVPPSAATSHARGRMRACGNVRLCGEDGSRAASAGTWWRGGVVRRRALGRALRIASYAGASLISSRVRLTISFSPSRSTRTTVPAGGSTCLPEIHGPPRAGVDDHVGGAELFGGLFDRADGPVGGHDGVAGQAHTRPVVGFRVITPHVVGHTSSTSGTDADSGRAGDRRLCCGMCRVVSVASASSAGCCCPRRHRSCGAGTAPPGDQGGRERLDGWTMRLMIPTGGQGAQGQAELPGAGRRNSGPSWTQR